MLTGLFFDWDKNGCGWPYKNIFDFKSFRAKIRFNYIVKLFLFYRKVKKTTCQYTIPLFTTIHVKRLTY